MQENNNDSQSTDPSSLPGDPSVTGVRFGANPHYPSVCIFVVLSKYADPIDCLTCPVVGRQTLFFEKRYIWPAHVQLSATYP